jgi:hypothetical protein
MCPPDAEGAARARSATEPFLYRRLETLADTRGRFTVNISLPLASCGSCGFGVSEEAWTRRESNPNGHVPLTG